ncbi:MAG: hypothetical protein A3E83_09010 [Gammaproteobacteria bacterium RIFCSPHIGHO2_12_FULL_41_20]|nr:MAG: hypothetical protein A3E83_09010 [Gammaproteobacteria bacterium RIFCSPHIGHO2_12_FULL_41_20]
MTNSTFINEQGWLIKKIKELGYPVDEEGMCYGIAAMALQAILVGGLADFKRRLLAIRDTPNLKEAIEAAKTARNARFIAAKKQAKSVYHKEWEELSEEVKNHVRAEVDAALTQQERDLLTVYPFFDGIGLYYYASLFYTHLFGEEAKPIGQDFLRTFPLAKPTLFIDHISSVNEFSGVYNLLELNNYFGVLRKCFSEVSYPITLFLSSGDHVMVVAWSSGSQGWILVDPNKLPYLEGLSDQEVAAAVLSGFSGNEFAAFSAQVFIQENYREHYRCKVSILLDDPIWSELHIPTVEKSNRRDSACASWLHVAVRGNHEAIAVQLLDLGSASELTDGRLLFIAAQHGHMRLVWELLARGCDPNKVYGKAMPLHIAALEGHVQAVEALLESGADPTSMALASGKTAIEIAAYYQYPEIVELLKHALQQRASQMALLSAGQVVSAHSLFSSTTVTGLSRRPLPLTPPEQQALLEQATRQNKPLPPIPPKKPRPLPPIPPPKKAA